MKLVIVLLAGVWMVSATDVKKQSGLEKREAPLLPPPSSEYGLPQPPLSPHSTYGVPRRSYAIPSQSYGTPSSFASAHVPRYVGSELAGLGLGGGFPSEYSSLGSNIGASSFGNGFKHSASGFGNGFISNGLHSSPVFGVKNGFTNTFGNAGGLASASYNNAFDQSGLSGNFGEHNFGSNDLSASALVSHGLGSINGFDTNSIGTNGYSTGYINSLENPFVPSTQLENQPSYAAGTKGLGHYSSSPNYNTQLRNSRPIALTSAQLPPHSSSFSSGGSKGAFRPSTFLGSTLLSSTPDYEQPSLTSLGTSNKYLPPQPSLSNSYLPPLSNSYLPPSTYEAQSAPSPSYQLPNAAYDLPSKYAPSLPPSTSYGVPDSTYTVPNPSSTYGVPSQSVSYSHDQSNSVYSGSSYDAHK